MPEGGLQSPLWDQTQAGLRWAAYLRLVPSRSHAMSLTPSQVAPESLSQRTTPQESHLDSAFEGIPPTMKRMRLTETSDAQERCLLTNTWERKGAAYERQTTGT